MAVSPAADPSPLARRRICATILPLALLPLLGACQPPPPPDAADYRELWEAGVPFAEFLQGVESREETWRENAREASVPDDLLARAGDAGGPWKLLVVADDWCGDSAWTVPWMARLAESLDGLEMRVVISNVGRPVMHAHPSPDGRAATPTAVFLDEAFTDRGCFVERPPELQRWFLENPDDLPQTELVEEKYRRYEEDAGRSTLEELVRVMEAAARGEVRCVGVEAENRTALLAGVEPPFDDIPP